MAAADAVRRGGERTSAVARPVAGALCSACCSSVVCTSRSDSLSRLVAVPVSSLAISSALRCFSCTGRGVLSGDGRAVALGGGGGGKTAGRCDGAHSGAGEGSCENMLAAKVAARAVARVAARVATGLASVAARVAAKVATKVGA